MVPAWVARLVVAPGPMFLFCSFAVKPNEGHTLSTAWAGCLREAWSNVVAPHEPRRLSASLLQIDRSMQIAELTCITENTSG